MSSTNSANTAKLGNVFYFASNPGKTFFSLSFLVTALLETSELITNYTINQHQLTSVLGSIEKRILGFLSIFGLQLRYSFPLPSQRLLKISSTKNNRTCSSTLKNTRNNFVQLQQKQKNKNNSSTKQVGLTRVTIVGQLPIKVRWQDAPLALRVSAKTIKKRYDFSQA